MASSEETGTIIVNYKECRRNYAISIGGHAVDGCREFAPAGEQGTEQAFLCQACGCHRSFHRKEVIKNGVVHRAPPLAPPAVAFVPPVAQGYPLVPYVVVHPVDYGYPLPDQELSGESHHDDHHHHHHHPQQNDHQRGSAMDGLDQRSEMKPNGIKKPKMEPL